MPASKNRPHWRAPLKIYRPRVAPKPPTGGFRFGQIPEAARCRATARMTGERCRNPALHGAKHCGKHGGHSLAYRSERKALEGKPMMALPPVRAARRALAELGSTVDKQLSPSIIERGRQVEKTANTISADLPPRAAHPKVES
jgi:hypothetical protein